MGDGVWGLGEAEPAPLIGCHLEGLQGGQTVLRHLSAAAVGGVRSGTGLESRYNHNDDDDGIQHGTHSDGDHQFRC